MSYQQTPPQPDWTQHPQPPRKRGGKVAAMGCLGSLAFLILIVIVAAAVDGSDKPESKQGSHTSAPAHKAGAPSPKETGGLSKREITKLSVDVVWNNYTAAQRDAACLGIDTYGKDWYAKQLKSKNIDPDYAADRLADHCASR
jgi:hypothetical protein